MAGVADDERVAASLRYFGDGDQLGGHTLKLAFTAATGVRPSKAEVAALLGHDRNKATRGAFEAALRRHLAGLDPRDELWRVFSVFDGTGKGFVTREDLERVCGDAAPGLSRRTVLEAFDEADAAGRGRLTFAQFERLVLSAPVT
jgi:Ca2+-binding EF-hand superfamily protein